jgi:hypothetical protein
MLFEQSATKYKFFLPLYVPILAVSSFGATAALPISVFCCALSPNQTPDSPPSGSK